MVIALCWKSNLSTPYFLPYGLKWFRCYYSRFTVAEIRMLLKIPQNVLTMYSVSFMREIFMTHLYLPCRVYYRICTRYCLSMNTHSLQVCIYSSVGVNCSRNFLRIIIYAYFFLYDCYWHTTPRWQNSGWLFLWN